MKENRIVKNAVILTIMAVLLSAILGFTNQITKDRIAEQDELKKQKAYTAVFEDASFEETDELTALAASSKEDFEAAGFSGIVVTEAVAAIQNGETAGYVLNITNSNGYGGNIVTAIGITVDGKMTGLSVISNSETAGLGANCSKESFSEQFKTIDSPEISFVKGGGADHVTQIDAISSATITTTAVTNTVNAALHFVYDEIGIQ